MTRNKRKQCRTCEACEHIYLKSKFYYWQACTEDRYCTKHKKMTESHGHCELWEEKTYDYDLSQERFNKTEQDIHALFELFDD